MKIMKIKTKIFQTFIKYGNLHVVAKHFDIQLCGFSSCFPSLILYQ